MADPGERAGVVLAVRISPGNFLLAAERVTEGLEFEVPPNRFRVVSEPVSLGSGEVLATVRMLTGPQAGGQLTARLQTGQRATDDN